jgi:N-acyl-D-amino-acid deacylase
MFDPLLGRREFLGTAVGLAFTPFAPAQSEKAAPITGSANPDLEPFDQLMTSFIEENKVPGAALAVTRRGRLVYARGFGFADVEKKEAVQPDALFRIASVSKPITAVAVMQLVEKRQVQLDDKVLDHIKLTPYVDSKGKRDDRWNSITIRQCLQHTGGWDRDKSYDPIGRPKVIAKAFGVETPVAPDLIVRYMMGQPLDFDPGSRYAYSNLGYLVLGRIIEAAAGEKYEAYVKKHAFEPLGIKAAQLGRALPEFRVKGEVAYYDSKKRMGASLLPADAGKQVALPHAMNIEGFEAHGGWLASAVELVKFAAAFDDRNASPLLGAKAINEMWAPSAFESKKDEKHKDMFYACGWDVRRVGDGKSNQWHSGYIPGSEALLVRRWDGLNWAVLFNTADNPKSQSLSKLIDGRLHKAADQVKRWPADDQFGRLLT